MAYRSAVKENEEVIYAPFGVGGVVSRKGLWRSWSYLGADWANALQAQ